MPLHLIRSKTVCVSEYAYESKTDVWFFGDRESFSSFIDDLRRACSATEPIHVAAIPDSSMGMRCVIMPASEYQTQTPVLKAVERVVFFREALAMQVVLCGNRRGYETLSRLALEAMQTLGGPSDHWHCDDACDDWLIRRSISLNLRGAVAGWNQADLDCYYDEIQTGGKYRLPGDVAWLGPEPEFAYDYLPSDICSETKMFQSDFSGDASTDK